MTSREEELIAERPAQAFAVPAGASPATTLEGTVTDAAKELPAGHPLAWDDLVPFEKDQCGYWLYPSGRDVFGNDKIWVSVPNPGHASLPKACPHCRRPYAIGEA